MQQLEYKQLESCLYLEPADLNRLGTEGWLLVGMIDHKEPPVRYIFARTKEAQA